MLTPYIGPYKVTKVLSDVTVQVHVRPTNGKRGRFQTVHVSNTKPYQSRHVPIDGNTVI